MTVSTSSEHPAACPSSYANHKGQNEAGETAAEIRDSDATKQQQQQQQKTSPMNTEIEAAVTFLADVIKASRFDESATETFRQVLIALLAQHYEGHWYPNDPFKGSGYRCLRVNGVMNPLLTKAAQLSGLPIKKFRHAFPVELTVWVDPGDVSVRFGEEGSIGVYYAKAGQGLRHDHQHMEDFKRLVAAAPQRSLTPPAAASCSISSASVCSSLSSSSSSSRGYENLAATAAAARSPLSACSSLSSRNSPANLVGSPPSTSYIFSPYDGKSMHINSRQAVINGYSAAAAATATHDRMRQLSPLRKFQPSLPPPSQSNGQFYHQQQRNIFGRHTPPEAYNLYNQQQGAVGSYGMNAQQQQQTTAHFYGDLSKSDVQMLHQLELADFDALRRTPPLQGSNQDAAAVSSTAYRRLYESPEPSTATAWSSSNYQQQQAATATTTNADLQFCANTHFGSSWGPAASGAGAMQRQSPTLAAAHRFGRVVPRTEPINVAH